MLLGCQEFQHKRIERIDPTLARRNPQKSNMRWPIREHFEKNWWLPSQCYKIHSLVGKPKITSLWNFEKNPYNFFQSTFSWKDYSLKISISVLKQFYNLTSQLYFVQISTLSILRKKLLPKPISLKVRKLSNLIVPKLHHQTKIETILAPEISRTNSQPI